MSAVLLAGAGDEDAAELKVMSVQHLSEEQIEGGGG
jgi:hypothetical protein